jgi:hypothetical protein
MQIGKFLSPTGLVHGVGSAGNLDGLFQDLRVVAEARSRRDGVRARVVAVEVCIRRGGGKRIRLPSLLLSGFPY